MAQAAQFRTAQCICCTMHYRVGACGTVLPAPPARPAHPVHTYAQAEQCTRRPAPHPPPWRGRHPLSPHLHINFIDYVCIEQVLIIY